MLNSLKSDFLRTKEWILKTHGDEPCDSEICPMCIIKEDQADLFSHWRTTTQEMINNF